MIKVFATTVTSSLAFAVLVSAGELGGTVGAQGNNAPADVEHLQRLLNQVPADEGGAQPKLNPDGLMGAATLKAMETFRQEHFDSSDGPLRPDGPDYRKLVELVKEQSLNQRIVAVARGELEYWKNGEITERDPNVAVRLQDYWKSAGLKFSVEDMRSRAHQSRYPWSGAFVSWVMKQAGAGDDFHYTAAHWRYVAAAKRNRLDGNTNPFQAYAIDEKKPAPGDVVCKRRGNSKANYDNIERGHFTHGDVVVEVLPREIVTIGGNVSNSVRVTRVKLNDGGFVAEPSYFAIVKVAEPSSN